MTPVPNPTPEVSEAEVAHGEQALKETLSTFGQVGRVPSFREMAASVLAAAAAVRGEPGET